MEVISAYQTHYRVTYEIDIWAPNSGAAADQCYEWLLDPNVCPPVLSVLDVVANKRETIDLWRNSDV